MPVIISASWTLHLDLKHLVLCFFVWIIVGIRTCMSRRWPSCIMSKEACPRTILPPAPLPIHFTHNLRLAAHPPRRSRSHSDLVTYDVSNSKWYLRTYRLTLCDVVSMRQSSRTRRMRTPYSLTVYVCLRHIPLASHLGRFPHAMHAPA
ncbi:hypothetical protein C8Q80DRAFT_290989 [Daedaleopsis nitida]|nr:hypothetical protein C8Q80DRAFT_290989 [Daedaleopsis nitida]